ncbi:MAG: hypothetical protein HY854_06855 [Burkholderiales bacterium]|nr:hypothetical protein [Burkholderiales bacterium]
MLLKLFTVLLAGTATAAAAQSVCSSDAQPRPVHLLERFVNADCEDCWNHPATPQAARAALVLDWIVPGSKGEDAPLSAAASNDALARLQALKRKAPARMAAVRAAAAGPAPRVRIAQGVPINDYIGTSIELKGGPPGRWRAWLLLVEALPAGTEGSPVARNLVRNAFVTGWDGRRPLYEARSMQLREGTHPSRLRLVALVEDAQGRIRGMARSECAPEGEQR